MNLAILTASVIAVAVPTLVYVIRKRRRRAVARLRLNEFHAKVRRNSGYRN